MQKLHWLLVRSVTDLLHNLYATNPQQRILGMTIIHERRMLVVVHVRRSDGVQVRSDGSGL